MFYDINTSLVLETVDESEKRVYKARIADIKNDSLYIEMPLNNETNRIEAPLLGTKLKVWFQTPDRARANFDTEVIGKVRENIAMLIVAKPLNEDIQKNQRRDFVRVPAIVEAAIDLQTKDGNISFVCKTDDISGGGFSIKYNSSIKITIAQQGKAWLVLPKKNKNIIHALVDIEVVRTKYPENPNHLAWASFRFKNILESERSKIIQYTFERQIDLYGR